MALTSPRFQSSDTLRRVEAGSAALNAGSSGRAVHLVQFALVDLGFSMPRSTGNAASSPDGVYGEETRSVVRTFQQGVPGLTVDGVVGQQTLRALDQRIGGFRNRVRLHFRSIALTNVPFERSLANAEAVYAQYGIRIEFGSGESIGLSPDQRTIFDRIDQECDWDLSAGEFHMLQGLGSPAPSSDILVFHVSSFADANVLGCGGHAANRPACTITASALAWDTAHEVGHVLLGSSFNPVHVPNRKNLMHPISRSEASIPVLTLAQVNRIRASPCCHAA